MITLLPALNHYNTMMNVSDIVVYVNGVNDTSKLTLKLLIHGLSEKVRAIALPNNNLMERFKPVPDLKTQGWFQL